MKINKVLTNIIVGIGYLFVSLPVKAEWKPGTVVQGIYSGIQQIHGYQATPKLIWDVPNGAS